MGHGAELTLCLVLCLSGLNKQTADSSQGRSGLNTLERHQGDVSEEDPQLLLSTWTGEEFVTQTGHQTLSSNRSNVFLSPADRSLATAMSSRPSSLRAVSPNTRKLERGASGAMKTFNNQQRADLS